MIYKLFKLDFVTPLHIGTNRPGFESSDDILHSDTLFSAMINCWSQLYPDDITQFFPEESDTLVIPFFTISSAFPYLNNTLFFPRPYMPLNIPTDVSESNPNLIKKLKTVNYFSQSLFETAICGEALQFGSDWISADGKFADNQIFGKVTADSPFKMIDVPRIVKDRMTEEATPYHFTRIQFHRDAGLFFLAQFQDVEWERKFTAVLRLLGDTGIGGDRSVGHGLFQMKNCEELSLRTPIESKHVLTLSLYHPTVAEIPYITAEASYQLIERKGWVFSGRSRPLRRQTVRMFREGSIFPGTVKGYGDTVRVLRKLPELSLHHDVYRFGQALVIPTLKGGPKYG